MARGKAQDRSFSTVPYFVSGLAISKSYHPMITVLSYSNLSLPIGRGGDRIALPQIMLSGGIPPRAQFPHRRRRKRVLDGTVESALRAGLLEKFNELLLDL